MREIRLHNGMMAVVDDEDFDKVSGLTWYAIKSNGGRSKTWYAQANLPGQRRSVKMHRLLKGAPDKVPVDHEDGDGLNNRQNNLRLVTYSENQINQGVRASNTSGAVGVSWCKRRKKWRAGVGVGGRTVPCGYFEDKADAVAARDAAVERLYPGIKKR